MPRRPGRPSKFDDAAPLILEAIAVGGTREDAANYARIDESTLYKWIRRGREAKSGKYFQFVQDMKSAESDGKLRSLETIHSAANGRPARYDPITGNLIQEAIKPQWQAAAWYLERKYKDQYAKQATTIIAGEDGKPPAIVIMTPEEYEALK